LLWYTIILLLLVLVTVTSSLLAVIAHRNRHETEETLREARDELERHVDKRIAELLKENEQLNKQMVENEEVMEGLKRSLMQIDRESREWESTVDSLPQIICLIDSQGTILRANRTVEQWTPWRVTDVKGRRIHELFHPGCTSQTCYFENFWPQAWNDVVAGRSSEFETEDKVIERYLYLQVWPVTHPICGQDGRTLAMPH